MQGAKRPTKGLDQFYRNFGYRNEMHAIEELKKEDQLRMEKKRSLEERAATQVLPWLDTKSRDAAIQERLRRSLGLFQLQLIKSGKRSVVFKGLKEVLVANHSKSEDTWWCIRVHLVHQAA